MEIENSSAIDKKSTVPFKFQGDFFLHSHLCYFHNSQSPEVILL